MKPASLWILFFFGLVLTLGLKAVDLGWFSPREPLEFNNAPALLFFNKARGCECELYVYDNANAQFEAWKSPVPVHRIDLDRRPDLGRQYSVVRAPALVLVDAEGQVVWKQSDSLSDESPLNLEQAQVEIARLQKTESP
jgi:hypothetical protein